MSKLVPAIEFQEFLSIHEQANPLEDLTLSSIPRLRIEREKIAQNRITEIEVQNIWDTFVDSDECLIPIRIYIPYDRALANNYKLPVLVFYHGGGWTLGSIRSYDNINRFLCNKIPSIVISAHYRQAPENPFPAAVKDAYQAYLWTVIHAQEFGGDPQRIAVGGDSAGGNLATVVALCGAKEGVTPLFQALFYPSVNISKTNYSSYLLYGENCGLTQKAIENFRSLYLPNPTDWKNPQASPLLADDAELRLLPPAFIFACGCDPLRDEAEEYTNKLRKNQVPVHFKQEDHLIHQGLGLFNNKSFPEASRYVEPILNDLAQQIRSALAPRKILNKNIQSTEMNSASILSARELNEENYLELMPRVFNQLYGPMALPAAQLLWKNSGPVFAVDALIRAYEGTWALEGPLSLAERSLITVAALIAQGLGPQIKLHINGFVSSGGTLDQLFAIASLVTQKINHEMIDLIIDSLEDGLKWRGQYVADFKIPLREDIATKVKVKEHEKILNREWFYLSEIASEIAVGRVAELRKVMKILIEIIPKTKNKDHYMDLLITHLIVYCGYPKGMNAFRVWQELRNRL